jgi:alpha-mannosidase
VKRAEDERGWILRLQQTGDRDTTATITLPHFQPKKAWLCNMIEENQKELAVDGHTVRAPVKGKGIATVRVQ